MHFTDNLPEIQQGFIDPQGRITSMITGEIFCDCETRND
jgi:hypothetical protein